MAKLYPDLANIDRLTVPPTGGERSLLGVLGDLLDDAYEVYFNPYLDGDRPDVIVIKPGCGALIIEVKDWNLNHYQVDIGSRWLYEGKAISLHTSYFSLRINDLRRVFSPSGRFHPGSVRSQRLGAVSVVLATGF